MNDTDTDRPAPHCVFVTGPRGPGKSRWLEERVMTLVGPRALPGEAEGARPRVRCAVILAEERLTHTTRFADAGGEVAVRCVFMPCLCCPGAADLPRVVRDFAKKTRADWLFIEVPALAAANLINEFDRVVGWPRETVVWLNREWARARRARTLSFFQTQLLARADHVVDAAPGHAATDAAGMPTLSFT